MQALLSNPGLNLIVYQISRHLDAKSLAKCRLVNKSWRDVINCHRKWLICQLDYIQSEEKEFIENLEPEKFINSTISERFPEWKSLMKEFSKKCDIARLKEIVKQMWIYFRDRNVNYKTNPFHNAARKSNVEFMKLLIDLGIDLNLKSLYGLTAIHHACFEGNTEMVQLLLKHDANAGAHRADTGDTIFHIAAQNVNPRVLQIVLDTIKFDNTRDKMGRTMLHSAVLYGTIETIKFLITSHRKIGFKLEEKCQHESTILHLACWKRELDIIDLIYGALQDNKCQINFDTRTTADPRGVIMSVTPLHRSFYNKNPNVFINLTNRYPDKINAFSGCSHMVHIASYSGKLHFVKHIFENPAFNVAYDIVNDNGNTALHCACINGQIEVVKYLINLYKNNGIDIYAKNLLNMTAEWRAKFKRHHDIVALFEAEREERRITNHRSKKKESSRIVNDVIDKKD